MSALLTNDVIGIVQYKFKLLYVWYESSWT